MEDPEELRELGFLCRPLIMTQASIRNAPTNMPGNSPARNTPIGNLLHCSLAAAVAPTAVELVVEVAVEELVLDVFVADEVVVEELDAVSEDESVFPTMLVLVIMAHTDVPAPSVTQLYPNGQHLLPHVGNLSPNLVVNICAPGFDVAFCFEISHESG